MECKDKFKIYEGLKAKILDFFNANNDLMTEAHHFDRLLKEDIHELQEDLIQSTGYVMHTLETSIWCLLTTNTYNEAVLKAVNLGDDTDTSGTVTGGLAGLLYGFESMPWVASIRKGAEINELISSLSS